MIVWQGEDGVARVLRLILPAASHAAHFFNGGVGPEIAPKPKEQIQPSGKRWTLMYRTFSSYMGGLCSKDRLR